MEEEQSNDLLKQQLAEHHNVKYIVLDCRYSLPEYIKQSIMSSELPEILSFTETNIDWNKATEYANGSLFIEVVKLSNSGLKNKEIAEALRIKYNAVSKYLTKARKLGMCDNNIPNYKG